MYKLTRSQWLAFGEPVGSPERGFNDPISAAISAATAIGSSLISSDASQSAADTQANAANQSTQAQRDMFNTINGQQAPWRQAGQIGLSSLLTGLGENNQGIYPTTDAQGNPITQTQNGSIPVGYFSHQFDANDLKSNLAPNYDFMLKQGLGALSNSAASTGGLVSGNALKGLNDYAQNYAGNAYQNAFNNYTTNQSNIFNRLSTIAGYGPAANQVTAQAGTTAAGNIGSSLMAGGAAQAAGTIGSANAITGGLNNANSWYQLSNIFGNNSGGGSSGSSAGSYFGDG